MTPREKPYICYRGRKYRDIERRLERETVLRWSTQNKRSLWWTQSRRL